MAVVMFELRNAKLMSTRLQRNLNGQPAVLRGIVAPEVVSYSLQGVTRDNAGAPLASCTVDLFSWPAKTLYASAVSDASGIYRVNVGPGVLFRAISYNANDTVTGSSAGNLSGV